MEKIEPVATAARRRARWRVFTVEGCVSFVAWGDGTVRDRPELDETGKVLPHSDRNGFQERRAVRAIPQTCSVVPARSSDSGGSTGVGPPDDEVSGPSQAVKDAFGAATAMSCAHPLSVNFES
ncbi:hypothetical protein ACIBL8_46450 [Streptomyces sp. NPDC050523]|uniref:hypothetical protein n=1 Tax=Streptomyces sp. NPDC050523 TaxID=3365622 RepID=UPI0037BC91FF